jgi:hypothetical protein
MGPGIKGKIERRSESASVNERAQGGATVLRVKRVAMDVDP